jgi:pyruvate-ferredoxin/flavodoxin oxidoreductase
VPATAPEFVREVTAPLLEDRGDQLPVSLLPADGTFPSGTSRYEKRAIAREIPRWQPSVCIQCGKCPMVCPHAAIRLKVYEPSELAQVPPSFQADDYHGNEYEGMKMTIQVAPEDCTGCGLCVEVCPARDRTEPRRKALEMVPLDERIETERESYAFFLDLPELDRRDVRFDSIKGSQVLEPLFEYSGACAGCGETPYLKLLSQLFGDRALIANATGCSSIYGGNLPTTPWSTNREGRGPAWNNSLFEDAGEFGLGFRLALDAQRDQAARAVRRHSRVLGETLATEVLEAPQLDESQILEQRERVAELREKLVELDPAEVRVLEPLLESLVKKSVWVVGGDGWAYDIGFGGLDHLLASGRDVNVLLLDTEVYSNTGGQMSKSTPRAAIAKFAAGGKPTPKKDIGLIAMAHSHAYVAQVAMGANDRHTLRAFLEAERYPGPSLIIAYSHCVAHGIDMARGMEHQKLAVDCGHWPLYRYNPERVKEGRNPLRLDSKKPRIPFRQFAALEARFQMLVRTHPGEAHRLLDLAQQDVDERWNLLSQMADIRYDAGEAP